MADSFSDADENLLIPELANPDIYKELLSTLLPFDVSDTVKEEYSADSQAGIHYVQCQDSLLDDGYCTLQLPDPHIQYSGLSIMSPPVPTATSAMPATVEYPGPHNFEIQVDSRSAGRNWVFSNSLNKLFITINNIMHLGFRCSSDAPDVYIRALLIYTEAQHFKDPVIRCSFHKSPLDAVNKDVNERLLEYVLHADHSKAVYETDDISGRQSVRVALDRLQAGAEWVTVPFRFMCKNSCLAGMNRRSTEVIFTLENESGDVLGRRKIKVRICSCPKRDKVKEETDAETNQKQKMLGGKRKIAARPEPQNQQVAKRKFESFCQIFLTKEDCLYATVLAHTRIRRTLRAENREPSEKEAVLLQKYENELKHWI